MPVPLLTAASLPTTKLVAPNDVIRFVCSAPDAVISFALPDGIDDVRITALSAPIERTMTMSGWKLSPPIVWLDCPSPVYEPVSSHGSGVGVLVTVGVLVGVGVAPPDTALITAATADQLPLPVIVHDMDCVPLTPVL